MSITWRDICLSKYGSRIIGDRCASGVYLVEFIKGTVIIPKCYGGDVVGDFDGLLRLEVVCFM